MAQSSATPLLRIGTRGSPLALAQANQVRARLVAALACEAERIAIVPIRTTGDPIKDRPLADAGGKGLFTKEIEEAGHLAAGAAHEETRARKDSRSCCTARANRFPLRRPARPDA